MDGTVAPACRELAPDHLHRHTSRDQAGLGWLVQSVPEHRADHVDVHASVSGCASAYIRAILGLPLQGRH
jgi:hypothetical protein